MNTTLTLRREGTFSFANPQDTSCQCGTAGTREYKYVVELDCPIDALDDKGFIVDQNDIATAIEKHWNGAEVLPSCERLAQQTAEVVAGLCANMHEVRAEVGNGQNAFMRARIVSVPRKEKGLRWVWEVMDHLGIPFLVKVLLHL